MALKAGRGGGASPQDDARKRELGASGGWGGGGIHGQGRVRGVDEGRRGIQDGPPASGTRSAVGTGSPATTGRPFRQACNGTVARTCLVIPRHRVVDRILRVCRSDPA